MKNSLSSVLEHLTENQKDGISMSFISLRFSADQVVCNQGDQADSLYLIKEVFERKEGGGNSFSLLEFRISSILRVDF